MRSGYRKPACCKLGTTPSAKKPGTACKPPNSAPSSRSSGGATCNCWRASPLPGCWPGWPTCSTPGGGCGARSSLPRSGRPWTGSGPPAVLAAEEAERHRIGADLHDGIGQLLSVVKINMNGLCEELRPRLEADEAQRFGDALDLVDESVREVRGISHNLLPNALIKRGLARAVREFLDKLQRPGRLKIRLETLGLDAPRLDPTVESALYRVIQELVQNIIKHAQATEVEMQIIRHAHELTLLVEDNGVGFDVPTHGAGDGVGLQSVGSRVAYLGGTLHVDSRIGRGTTVTATVPM